MSANDWQRGEFRVSTDADRLDLDVIYRFLSQHSEWARGIPRATFEKSVRHSLCFGLLRGGQQIGFARVISDRATVAYLGDVFVLPEYRKQGLATWLMECIMSHPDLQHLRRWVLITEDAHGLYQKSGFRQLVRPQTYMEIHNPDVYKDSPSSAEFGRPVPITTNRRL